MNGNHSNTSTSTATPRKPHVLIVGAGFGGLGTAWQLDQYNKQLTDLYRVTLLDAGDSFSIGGTWQFVWNNRLSLNQVQWPLERAAFRNIGLMLNTKVLEWDVAASRVRVQQKRRRHEQWIEYDKIVMACGVTFDSEQIPGLAACTNICSYDHVVRMKEELHSVLQTAKEQESVTIVLTISSVPYKCPPAPFEVVFLVEEAARQAKVRDKIRIVLTCPVEWPMPLSSRDVFSEVLQQRRIEYWPLHVISRIDAETKTIYFDEKTAKHKNLTATLIWSVHPIRAPDFVQQANIVKDRRGFLPVANKLTQAMSYSHHHNNNNGDSNKAAAIYAIGDCCSVSFMDRAVFIMPRGAPPPILPKNGEFAFKMGISVAHDIMSNESQEMLFDRSGSCIAEIGGTQGLVVEPDFTESCQNDAVPPIMHVDYYNRGEERKVEWVNSYLEMIFGGNVPKLSINQTNHVQGALDDVDFQEMWRKWQ